MTGEETETAAGRGPSATWRSGTMVAGLLIGLLFVVSAVSSAGIDLRPPFRVVWQRGLKGFIEFPAVVWEGVAYVNNIRGYTQALSLETG
jgi:hypothetical protein